MKKKLLTILCVLALLLGAFGVAAAAVDANTAAVIGETPYVSLQAAIDAVNQGTQVGLIQLKKAAEAVTVNGDVYVDLNGFDIASVDVKSGTFYGADSQTDDYVIDTQNHTGYGKILSAKGAVKGAPVEADFTDDSYLMVEETDIGTSFHCVNLRLTDMTLRPESVGLYFKSNFGGDALVAQQVAKFGVALSVKGEPTRENLKTDCQLSSFTGFEAGANDDATSTLLEGVMKEKNAKIVNSRNAAMPVYGKAYVLLHNGDYIFGKAQVRTLQEQVKELSKDEAKITDAVVDMYSAYRPVMKVWQGISAIKESYENGYLRILGIGNSYTGDSMNLLNEVYKTENPDKKVTMAYAYYGGCTIAQHARFIRQNEPNYTYLYINEEGTWNSVPNVTLEYIVMQQDWDLVSMQQGSSSSGQISTYKADEIQYIRDHVNSILGYEPTYMWNMTWAWPVEDVAGDAFATVTTAAAFESYYASSQETMYRMILDCVQQRIVTDPVFEHILPVGTAIQNARGTFLGDPDLHRDGSHVSDLGRLIASYVWYSEIEGVKLDSIKLRTIPEALTYSWPRAGMSGDMPIDDATAAAVAASVKSAMNNKFESTNIMQKSDPAQDDELNVLMIGGSFCYYYVEELCEMLDAAGIKANICNVYSSGCPLYKHWEWWKAGTAKYSFYSTTMKDGKVNRVLIGETEATGLDTCLKYANWDVITLQEASTAIRNSGGVANHLDYTKQARQELWAYLKKQFPQAEYLWHQIWSYQIGYDRSGYQMLDFAQQQADMQEHKDFALAVCQEDKVGRVNTGEAWQIIRQNGFDNLCARLSKDAGVGDFYHDGDIGGGQYLNACVWFETLTGQSCIGNTYVPSYKTSLDLTNKLSALNLVKTSDGYRFSDAFIASIQEAAHNAVQLKNAEDAEQ